MAAVDKQPISLSPCEMVKAEIAKYNGWDVNIMFAIAQAENGSCSPTRHNLTSSETHRRLDGSVICVGSYGVLQVACSSYNATEDRDSLALQVAKAYGIWSSRNTWGDGYQAWSTYNNGAYKAHL